MHYLASITASLIQANKLKKERRETVKILSFKIMWRVGRVVRQGSAKPCTPVQIRYAPPKNTIRAGGGTGIHDRLKICCQIRLEGSSPSPPTKATNPLWDFLLCREISNENLGSANEERRLNTEFTLVFDEHRREKAIAAVPLRPPVIILLK